MPKVTRYVARIDHPKVCPSALKGQQYWHWRVRYKGAKSGSNRCTVGRKPRQSELTMSDFWINVYSLLESIEDYGCPGDGADLENERESWAQTAEDIAEETREKYENMPQELQQGETGVMLEERVQAMEQLASDIRAIDVPESWGSDEFGGEEEESAYQESICDAYDEFLSLSVDCQ